MPFQRPTLTETLERTDASIATRLGIGPFLRRTFLGVLSKVLSGESYQLHGHLDYNADQLFIDTAAADNLDRRGLERNIIRKAATYAVGLVDFTGADGSVIPAGTIVRRDDNGATYATDEIVGLFGGATVAVTALASGLAGNAAAGTVVSLLSPVSGVASGALVGAGGLALGADQEPDDQYRARVLQDLREPPQGGADADYKRWAGAISLVTKVFVVPQLSGAANNVGVMFLVDDPAADNLPDGVKVAEVQASLDILKPVASTVTVLAPTSTPYDVSLSITPDTAALRLDVEAAIADFVFRVAEPGGTIHRSQLLEAISTVPGEETHAVTNPGGDVSSAPTEIYIGGTVSWS